MFMAACADWNFTMSRGPRNWKVRTSEPDGVTTVGYENFTGTEPDGGSSANCAAINYNGRRESWADDACTSTRRFVCEL